METAIAILIGLLVACGIRMLLDRSLFRILIGLALLAQAANVLVFAAAGLGDGSVPIIAADADAVAETAPDALAQALVLTAIVISFGVLAFCLTLLKRSRRETGGSDVHTLSSVES